VLPLSPRSGSGDTGGLGGTGLLLIYSDIQFKHSIGHPGPPTDMCSVLSSLVVRSAVWSDWGLKVPRIVRPQRQRTRYERLGPRDRIDLLA